MVQGQAYYVQITALIDIQKYMQYVVKHQYKPNTYQSLVGCI